MSVQCQPINLSTSLNACECTLVSFDVKLLNVCNHSRFGIVAYVIKIDSENNRTIVATVCRIVDTGNDTEDCVCVPLLTETFTDVVIDVPCCEDLEEEGASLTVEAHGNYIERCTFIPSVG